LGKLEIQISILKNDKAKIIKAYNEVLLKQKEVVDNITKKYGKVKLDLNTWEILPTEE